MSLFAEAHVTLVSLAAPTPTPAATNNGEIKNPLDGVTPDITVFGTAFDAKWKVVIAGLWALAIAVAVIALGKSIVEYVLARRRGHTDGLSEASREIRQSGIGLGLLAGLPLLVSAILTIAS